MGHPIVWADHGEPKAVVFAWASPHWACLGLVWAHCARKKPVCRDPISSLRGVSKTAELLTNVCCGLSQVNDLLHSGQNESHMDWLYVCRAAFGGGFFTVDCFTTVLPAMFYTGYESTHSSHGCCL